MIYAEVKLLDELDCHYLSHIFNYGDKKDETIFFNLIKTIQTKISLNLKINIYETLALYCSFIVNEIRANTCMDEIPRSAKRLLFPKNVMIGVPEMLKNTLFNIEVDYGSREQIILKEPIKIDQYVLSYD
jgi:urease gamma subunit